MTLYVTRYDSEQHIVLAHVTTSGECCLYNDGLVLVGA
jgi:hypothetical protein